jgi:hypothetical protein
MIEMRSEVTRQLVIQTAPSQVLFALRIDDSTAQNVMMTQRDIYNVETQLRRDQLESLTLIQALIREFDEED